MKEDKSILSPLERAKSRVAKVKGFYKHLTTYIIVNLVLIIFSGKVTFILLSEEALGNPEFLKWINWHIFGTPIVWGIGLLIHAAAVFLPSPFKKWEQRQIQRYMDKDRNDTKRFL